MAGLGFYILTGEAFSIISNDAVINARVAIVRSPIDGVLNLKSLMIGRRVQAREALGSVTDERVDDACVRDLERNAGDLEAESSLLQAKLRNLTETRAELTSRTLSYQEGRLRQLRAQIHEAGAVRQFAFQALGDSEGQTGLPHAARTGE